MLNLGNVVVGKKKKEAYFSTVTIAAARILFEQTAYTYKICEDKEFNV